MTITYPVSLDNLYFASVTLHQDCSISMTESGFTYEQQVIAFTGERWRADADLPPMKEDEAESWICKHLQLRGAYGTFLLGDPKRQTARGTATGTPLVNGGSQTGRTLITDGWTSGVTGILKAGDHIQLGSGSSSYLHKVLADANSDGSGNATFDIWPALRTSPADNAAITKASCKGVFRLAPGSISYTIGADGLYRYSFQAVEAL